MIEIIKKNLSKIQNPMRYLGGDYGEIHKDCADFTFVIAFPDVYEIGMSNQAVKIIYNGVNSLENTRCERVFTPEVDFESFLKENNLPLYTLESKIPLYKTDVLGFSLGYELGMSGVFSILETGKIPLENHERGDADPIILAGGCGVTNPAPFTNFFDGIFIGEAEPELFLLIAQLAEKKRSGASRNDLLQIVHNHPHIWVKGKKTQKAFYIHFGKEKAIPAFFPVASVKPIQDHGVVEIMRGCPNGCRFCHAGVYYRPQRMKTFEQIISEVDALVFQGGYREISLTSLSSGDYQGIENLLDILQSRYRDLAVSFQLPSLKINSFTLPLLEKISQTRKSGLTFAIETPVEAWQFSLNKQVFEEKIYDIIMSAKGRGWNKAKFYFMVGLPVERSGLTEEEEIVQFLLKIQAATRIQCNVNVGTFIPKPHTPYQWVRQISPEEADKKLFYIRKNLPKGTFKVSTHNDFAGFLEGMISRGDERVGSILLAAYKKGARLDAWENHLNREIWQTVIDEQNWNVYEETVRQRDFTEVLPWHEVSLGVHNNFYKNEFLKSEKQELSAECSKNCAEKCGICNNNVALHTAQTENIQVIDHDTEIPAHAANWKQNIPVLYRVIFQFSKENGSEFLPHLSLLEVFYKAFLRSKLAVYYTEGFNPIVRLEFASNLSIGISSCAEIASCLLENDCSSEAFMQTMNTCLPKNIHITQCFIFPATNKKKRESLASILYGSEYDYDFFETPNTDFYGKLKGFGVKYAVHQKKMTLLLPFTQDRLFRTLIEEHYDKPLFEVVSIKKTKMYAQIAHEVADYFSVFEKIAQEHKSLLQDENCN